MLELGSETGSEDICTSFGSDSIYITAPIIAVGWLDGATVNVTA